PREDPNQMLHHAPSSRLRELAGDDEYLRRINNESQNLSEYLTAPLWYQKTCAESERSNTPITAYFSMEFGIHPSLPIYSGGLGVLAGDTMKTASVLGGPLFGVGLLSTTGFFHQSLRSA